MGENRCILHFSFTVLGNSSCTSPHLATHSVRQINTHTATHLSLNSIQSLSSSVSITVTHIHSQSALTLQFPSSTHTSGMSLSLFLSASFLLEALWATEQKWWTKGSLSKRQRSTALQLILGALRMSFIGNPRLWTLSQCCTKPGFPCQWGRYACRQAVFPSLNTKMLGIY